MGMYCGMYWYVLCFCVGMYLYVCADIARFSTDTYAWYVQWYVLACICVCICMYSPE